MDFKDNPLSKYSLTATATAETMGILPTLGYGAVATAVDIGTTLWNSLPITDTVETRDLLSRMSSDALAVYDEHTTAVQTASFIGGMVVPLGAAAKTMSLLRQGGKGISWFSEAGRASRLKEVEDAYSAGTEAASRLATAKTQYYAMNAANAVTDAVAAEVAIYSTLNAHPFMEDYKKDLAENFLYGVVLGGGVGVIGSRIIGAGEIKRAIAPIEKEATSLLTTSRKEGAMASEVTQAGTQFLARHQRIENMKGYLEKAKDSADPFTLSIRTQQVLESEIQKEAVLLRDSFLKASSEEIRGLEATAQNAIQDMLTGSRFVGVDKISFAKLPDALVTEKSTGLIGSIKDTFALLKIGKNKKGIVETTARGAVFLPLEKAFISPEDFIHYSTIADTGIKFDSLLKGVKDTSLGIKMREDSSILLRTLSSAEVEKQFAQDLVLLANRNLLDSIPLGGVKLAGDDLSGLKATYARTISMQNEGEYLGSLMVKYGDSQVSASSLGNLVMTETAKVIKEMQKEGLGIEIISRRTSTPVETVVKVISGEAIDTSNLLKFATEDSIKAALAAENRALSLSTNLNKIPTAQMRSVMNTNDMQTMSQQIVEANMLSSSSEFVREVGERLLSNESKAQRTFIQQKLGDVLSSQLGSSLTRSANSVVEKLGEVGVLLTAYGKNNIDSKTAAMKQFTKPLSDSMASVANNQAHLIEFNTAINLNASIKGARIFKDGSFYSIQKSAYSMEALTKMSMDEIATLRDAGEVLFTKVAFQGKDYTVKTKEVISALEQMQIAGRELYALKDVTHRSLGKGQLSDIGFWAPAANPRGKFIAYSFNTRTHETTMLMAKSQEELLTNIGEYKKLLGEDSKITKIVTKGDDQDFYNQLQGRHDPMFMAVADVGMLHSGASARATVSTNTEVMAELIGGYDHYIGKGIDDITRLQLDTVFEHLDSLSLQANKGFSEATLNPLQRMLHKPVDPGNVVKNILMGRSNLEEYQSWVTLQGGMQVVAEKSIQTISKILSPVLEMVPGKVNKPRTAEDWERVVKEMEDNGIVNPFKSVDDALGGKALFIREGTSAAQDVTPRLVALSSTLSATVMLRMAELAQPLVNILSLPILTSGAINRKMASSLMGSELDSTAKFSLIKTMTDGVRLMNHPVEGKYWSDLATKSGVLSVDWQELYDVLKMTKALEPGMLRQAELLVESNVVKMLSKPADMSEGLVRKVAFFNGVTLAKQAYPGISEAGVLTFARNFMDEAIGNYTSAQRPALFQGTVGAAMGLFQTYMVTLAQQMYRGVENREWKQLMKQMLAQQTIFGSASLPGFHPVSEAIGEHFSDSNYDLTTGTFRALPNKAAEILLYGLPSQLVGITTRGDIQPRIPNPLQGMDTIAAINITGQMYEGMERVVKAAFTADENTGKAMLEALSLQSISRPVARLSELFSGQSITKSGRVVENNLTINPMSENFWQLGTLSRVMATRPLSEIKAREAEHLDTLYGQIDAKERKELVSKLRSYVTNQNLDEEKLSSLNEEYMRTGTATGWRSAVNSAIQQSSMTDLERATKSLNPDSPTLRMMEDID